MAKVGRPMNKLHQEDVRSKIQASQLVNRLTDHAFGRVELTRTQVDAIKVLLGKSLPDLSSVQHLGDADNPIAHSIQFEIVDAKE